MCFAQCEVKCATHFRRNFTVQSTTSLRQQLIVPAGHTWFEKSHICLVDKCGFFRGSPCWTRTNDLRINSPSLYRLS